MGDKAGVRKYRRAKCGSVGMREIQGKKAIRFYFIFTALEKLREEFKADSESLAISEAISILSYDD